jgi:hypothetical protein
MSKIPKTLTGKINAIHRVFPIREIWFCNAGFGIIYIVPQNMQSKHHGMRGNKTVTFSYFRTLESCIDNEYKRIVLKKKIRGSRVEDLFEERPPRKGKYIQMVGRGERTIGRDPELQSLIDKRIFPRD